VLKQIIKLARKADISNSKTSTAIILVVTHHSLTLVNVSRLYALGGMEASL